MEDDSSRHMEEDSDSDNDVNLLERKERKKGRGSSRLPKLRVRHGHIQKRHIDFDANMNPIGKDQNKFISFIGIVARSKVNILWPEWRSIPKEAKDMVWKYILQMYDIQQTEQMKKRLLQLVRQRWKDFKYTLTNEYVRGPKRGEDPCQKYSFLDPADWMAFVASRHDPRFKELSARNKEKQAKNVYPHYLSRGGYKRLEERIMQNDLKALKEAAKSDPSIVVQTPPPPSRHKKWKEARIKKGQYINPAVAEIAKKIDMLEEQSSEGSFSPTQRMDILATAIGKPDHPGRVRGERGSVGLTQYFGQSSRASRVSQPTDDLISKIRDEVRQSLREELMAEMKSMVSSMQQGTTQHQTTPQGSPSTKEICNALMALGGHDSSSPTTDIGQPCFLRLEVPRMRVVADALFYKHGSTIHHQKISEDQVRVTVTGVRDGETEADVPFPTPEVVKLVQTIGTFILWPKHLVDEEIIPSMDPKDVDRYPCLAQLHEHWKQINKVDIQMPVGIVGEEKSYIFGLDNKDIRELLSLHELDIAWLQLAIMIFHKQCMSSTEKQKMYGYLCPASVQQLHNPLDKRIRYVSNTIGETKLPCYFAPVVEGYHWSLCVPCPNDNIIYWFDPLGHRPSNEMKSLFNTALKSYYLTTRRRIGKNVPTWVYPKCPKQQGSTECGYYIIRYMFEIVESGSTTKFDVIFDNDGSYTADDIDFIRNLLAQQLLQEH